MRLYKPTELLGGGGNPNNSQAAYAALVSPTGTVTPLSPLPSPGVIYSVALNNTGVGLIGGQDLRSSNQPAYAALVSPTGTLTPLSPLPSTVIIYSVSLSDMGVGLIGGRSPKERNIK